MDVFEKKLNEYAESGQIVDLQALFFKFTLDGFAKIGFNVDLNCMQQEESVPFAAAFDRCQGAIEYRFLSPLWRIVELCTPYGFRIKRDMALTRDFCNTLVKARVTSQEKSATSDLLTMFMKLKSADGSPLYTEEELASLVLNFIVAGRDTTAQALSWTMYYLSKNPRVKQKLVEEIQSVLSDSDRPDYEQIKQLAYAKAVFMETLRLSPSVPKQLKTAVADDILPNGTHIPKGACLVYTAYALGRSKEIWGDDALEFKPERWLDVQKQPSQFQYLVFNAGPRVCLGKSLAEMEGVFILVSFLKKFDYDVVRPEMVHYANSLTLPMRDGLAVKIKKRG